MTFRTLATALPLLLPTLAFAQSVDLNTITRVEVKGSSIEITGSKKPNFTTFTMTDPARLVIDISEAVFSGVPDELQVGNGTVTAIKTASYGSDASAIARVLIGFDREVETDIQSAGNRLVVKVLGGGGQAVAQATPPAEDTGAAERQRQEQAAAEQQRQAQAAEAERQRQAQAEAERQRQAQAQAEQQRQAAADAERQRQEQAAAEQRRQQEAASAAQAAADEERRRKEQQQADAAERRREQEAAAQAEADRRREEQQAAQTAAAERRQQEQEAAAAMKAEQQAEAQAKAEERRRQQEEARAEAARRKEEQAEAARREREERVAMRAPPAQSPDSRLSVSSRRKTMTLVGFKQQPQSSRVVVRTNEPVSYSVNRGAQNTVVVELENTQIDLENNTRRLDTSFFDTAVAMIDPEPGPRRTVRIQIQLKESVPYQTTQEGNELYIDFERPARR